MENAKYIFWQSKMGTVFIWTAWKNVSYNRHWTLQEQFDTSALINKYCLTLSDYQFRFINYSPNRNIKQANEHFIPTSLSLISCANLTWWINRLSCCYLTLSQSVQILLNWEVVLSHQGGNAFTEVKRVREKTTWRLNLRHSSSKSQNWPSQKARVTQTTTTTKFNNRDQLNIRLICFMILTRIIYLVCDLYSISSYIWQRHDFKLLESNKCLTAC